MTSRNLIAGAVLVVAVAAGAVVFAINRDSGSPGSTSTKSEAPTTLSFDTQTEPLSLSDLRGQPVAMGFVQAGCESCAADLKALSNIAAKMPNAHFIALNMPGGGSASALADFGSQFDANNITYAAYASNDISKRFGITSLDTILVLDAQGRITWRAVRPSQADIEEALSAAGA